MNIWSLKKSTELKTLLLLLNDRLVVDTWVIDGDEMEDSQSVRLQSAANPDLAAYISLHGQPHGCFGVHLEFPIHKGAGRYDNTQIAENLDQERTLQLLVMHLG
jgi:hypothetical protein